MEDKEYLSGEELDAFIKEHRGDKVFLKNKRKQAVLAPWLLELRSRQARYAAEQILGKPIQIRRWQQYWLRSTTSDDESGQGRSKPETPNTATFGGYRLRQPRHVGIGRRNKNKKK